MHIAFSPEILPSTIRSDFLEKLTITYQGTSRSCKEEDLIKIGHAEENQGRYNANLNLLTLSNTEKERLREKAFNFITFSSSIFEEGIEKFKKLLKDSKIGEDKFLIFIANKGHGGLQALDWYNNQGSLSRAGNIRQNLLNLTNICFSNKKEDVDFLVGNNPSTSRKEFLQRFRSLKPCVWGSDAHENNNLFHPSNGNTRDYTWIKADPTFEGLMQIVYEPRSGDRVYIGETKPDRKDNYKVIRKLKFNGSEDFPEEIVFNQNLCSIIGSRSSGKSALLAYLAHSIDKETTEILKKGPGEGEKYHWKYIPENYSIDWYNGKSNDESPGKVVYVPQDYLYKKSNDPQEIKSKIKPVLYKKLPEFKHNYDQTQSNIASANISIRSLVEKRIELNDNIGKIDIRLKDIGNKSSIQTEKDKTEAKIEGLKQKSQLSATDLRNYKNISAELLKNDHRLSAVKSELSILKNVTDEQRFFNNLSISLRPTFDILPETLQAQLKDKLDKSRGGILSNLNSIVLEYKNESEKDKSKIENKISKIREENSELIEKHQQNKELEKLIKLVNDYDRKISMIDSLVKRKQDAISEVTRIDAAISSEIKHRDDLLKDIKSHLTEESISDIKFDIEYNYNKEQHEKISSKVNAHHKSEFMEEGLLKIQYIKENITEFIDAIYYGKQKINIGNEKLDILQEVLTLTEDILFTAEMEGDKIGGFSEPTMTPGKRALFALRLILDESDDTWPLLIDQPEDDLDSRSIFDEIVPFLKEKKKERQIIMVSHNANLVIGSDSDQVIVANRNGDDRPNSDNKQFNYLTGSIEFSSKEDSESDDTLTSKGTCEHACEILDGGKLAFEQRKYKYNIK